MVVACEILGKLGMQGQARLLCEVVRPIYTDHASTAKGLREPEAALQYYLANARGGGPGPRRKPMARPVRNCRQK